LKKVILLLLVACVAAYLYFFGFSKEPIEYIKEKVKTVEMPAAKKDAAGETSAREQGGEPSAATGKGAEPKAGGKTPAVSSDPFVYATETMELRVIGYRWVKRLPKAIIGVRRGRRMIGVRVEFTLKGGREKIDLPHTVLGLRYGEQNRRAVGAFLSDRLRLKVMSRLDCETMRPDIVFIVPADVKPEAMQLTADDGWSLALAKVPSLEPKVDETGAGQNRSDK